MCPGRRLKNQIIFSVHWGKVDERVAKAKMTFKWNFFIKVERENISALKILFDFVKLQLVRICQLKSFLIRCFDWVKLHLARKGHIMESSIT